MRRQFCKTTDDQFYIGTQWAPWQVAEMQMNRLRKQYESDLDLNYWRWFNKQMEQATMSQANLNNGNTHIVYDKRAEVYRAIDTERDYQDAGCGNAARAGGEKSAQTLGEDLLVIDVLLRAATADWYKASSHRKESALHGVRKIAGMAVAIMERHGVMKRVVNSWHEAKINESKAPKPEVKVDKYSAPNWGLAPKDVPQGTNPVEGSAGLSMVRELRYRTAICVPNTSDQVLVQDYSGVRHVGTYYVGSGWYVPSVKSIVPTSWQPIE